MSVQRARKTKTLLTKSAELAVAVPQVVAHRMTRMAIAGPVHSARDQKEFKLMSDEKTAAFTQAWQAMATQMVVGNQALAMSMVNSFWSSWLKGKPTSANAIASQIQNAALEVLNKGMQPVHYTAVANAKRLARTRLK